MESGPDKDPFERWPMLDRAEALLRRLGLNDHALLLIMAGIVGLMAGGGVVLFRLGYEALTEFFVPGAHGHDVVEAVRDRPAALLIGATALGGLAVGAIHRFGLRGGDFHGVAQVIHAVAHREGRIAARNTAVRFVTNALSIAAGGSVGPEGPVIELGSGIGSKAAQVLRLSPERVRTLLGCGAAAGLSAAFNAPIAGAIFALEIVLRDFAVVTFSPIIVASVVATALSRMVLGSAPAFEVPAYELASYQELPLYVVLGLAAGLLGVAFSHALRRSERWVAGLPIPNWLTPGLGGTLLGVGLVFMPELYGVGYEPITALLGGELGAGALAVLLVAKFAATSLTLASGFAGGIFAPILFLGGALGGLVGRAAEVLWPAATGSPGAYALVGMAAVMAAVTHAPITAILLLFEMTGGYEVILPLMLSCIAAVAVAQSLSRDSAFTLGFRERGLDVNYGRESAILRDFYVEDVMHPEAPVVDVRTRFGEVLDRFLEHDIDRWYVVDGNEQLVGSIDLHGIKSVLAEQGLRWVVIAADVMKPVGTAVLRRENLEEAIHALSSSQEDEVPVLQSPDDRRVVGLLSRGDVLDLYDREVLRKDVLGVKLVHRDERTADYVDLPSQYVVRSVPVERAWAGRTLAELELRERHGVHVLAVKRPGRRLAGRNELPDPHEPLQRRDRLVVVGHADDLAALLPDATH